MFEHTLGVELQKPVAVNIVGMRYTIQYVDTPSEVDLYKRMSCWGQIDYWTRTIRIYDNGRPIEDIWQTIMHEVLHGIGELLHIKMLNDNDNHDELDVLALALVDTFVRNGWVTLE